MIKLILILIIIILLSLTLIKEPFNDFVDSNDCNFIPWGPTKKKCKSTCLYSPLKPHYDIHNKCDAAECTEKCGECNNKNLCQWVDAEQSITNDDPIEEKIILGAKAGGTDNITLNWECTVKPGQSINKYLIHYRSKNGHPLHIIDNDLNKKKNFIINDTYVQTDNLKPKHTYEFIVYGLLNTTTIFKSNKIDVHT